MTHQDLPQTIISMFHRRVRESGPARALHYPVSEQFESITWDTLAQQVRRMAAALQELGVRPGDRVVQLSENSPEWIVCDLAIQMARAVHVPLHASLSAEQIAYQVVDSEANIVLFGDRQQAALLSTAVHQLPTGLTFVACQPGKSRIRRNTVLRMADLMAGVTDQAATAIEQQALELATADDLASILYTSGTTGDPKGVMLTQRNFVSNTLSSIQSFDLRPDDFRLCFLPFSHVFARTCELYSWIAMGSELALAECREKIVRNCQELKPTALIGVPFFYNRLYQHLMRKGTAVHSGSLQRLLGGRIRGCLSGGAPIGDQVVKYFETQGIPLLQGYGMTEASPVISTCTDAAYKIGTVGKPIPGVKVKIADDGEILAQGPNIMAGYWKRPEDTARVIRDGWLHTGDRGQIDEEGYLTITGRAKEILVTSGGKNISPTTIEILLTEDPMIIQAMVVGEGRDYLSALIVPDPDALKAEIKARGIWVFSKAGAVSHPLIRELYQQTIAQRLKRVSYYEQVRRFHICDQGFTPENGLLTPTLKLRRDLIRQRYATEISTMYPDSGVGFAG